MCFPGGILLATPASSGFDPRAVPSVEAVPVKKVAARVKIVDFTAEVNLTQTFENEHDNPIEVEYHFTLDEKSSVCAFVATVDGTQIHGEMQKKEDARDTYEDGIASGHGTFMLEEDDEEPNVFTVKVGSLLPKKKAEITITYVQELGFTEEGDLCWVLPTRSDPYSRASPLKREGTSSVDVPLIPLPGVAVPSNPEKVYCIPKLDFSLELAMSSPIEKVSSPSHRISFGFSGAGRVPTVNLDSVPKDTMEDLEVRVKLKDPHTPSAHAYKSPNDDDESVGVMVSMYPKLELDDDEEIYTEMVFIVDRSGSMAGGRIKKVRDTLQFMLRSLSEGTMFNIIGFGSSMERLFPSSVEYNERNMQAAIDAVAKMKADLGGTEILTPLKEVLNSPPMEGYSRQLFILTDGEVFNTDQCIQFVRRHADTTRVFTFGIGTGASKALVRGLARAGEGFSEFVVGDDSMQGKVLRQLNRALQPALTDLTVHWDTPEGVKVDQAPCRLPPVFCGGHLVVYGLFRSAELLPDSFSVRVSGKSAIKDFSTEPIVVNVREDLEKQKAERLTRVFDCDKENDQGEEEKVASATSSLSGDPGTVVHKLAARALIRDIKENRSCFHDKSGALLDGHTKASVEERVVELSCSHCVLSHLTSFVAVHERRETVAGSMETRKVLPVVVGSQKSSSPVSALLGFGSSAPLSSSSFAFGGAPAYPSYSLPGAYPNISGGHYYQGGGGFNFGSGGGSSAYSNPFATASAGGGGGGYYGHYGASNSYGGGAPSSSSSSSSSGGGGGYYGHNGASNSYGYGAPSPSSAGFAAFGSSSSASASNRHRPGGAPSSSFVFDSSGGYPGTAPSGASVATSFPVLGAQSSASAAPAFSFGSAVQSPSLAAPSGGGYGFGAGTAAAPSSSGAHLLDLFSPGTAAPLQQHQSHQMNDLLSAAPTSSTAPSSAYFGMPAAGSTPASQPSASMLHSPAASPSFAQQQGASSFSSVAIPKVGGEATLRSSKGTDKDVSSGLGAIILVQKASGEWTLDAISSSTSLVAGANERLTALIKEPDEAAKQLWATAVVAAFVEHEYPDQKVNWSLNTRKAWRFVAKKAKVLGATLVDWKAEAKKLVHQHC